MALKKRAKGKRLTAPPIKAGSKSNTTQSLPIPYEDDMQKTIVDLTRLMPYKGRKVFDYLHHTPNGGTRHLFEATKLKSIGVKKGYPDLTIDIVSSQYAGLRIELKRGKLGVISDDQIDMLTMLNEEGYYAVICDSIDSAVSTIQNYVKGTLKPLIATKKRGGGLLVDAGF